MYSSTCTSACKHNSFHLSSYSCIYILNILLLHSKYVVLLLGLCQRFYYNRVNFSTCMLLNELTISVIK